MSSCRGSQADQRVAWLARPLGLGKSEVLRRAVNLYDKRYQSEFTAYDWLSERLDALPGSGRSPVLMPRRR